MKKVVAVLLVVCSVYCRADEPCSKPTDAEDKCMRSASTQSSTVSDLVAKCSGVDFGALNQGDVSGVFVKKMRKSYFFLC